MSIDQYSNQNSLSGKKVLTDIEFGSMNVTGDVSGSKVKSVTISKGFIYGAAVRFTLTSGKPYIQSKNISFWLENCDVSVASIAFS